MQASQKIRIHPLVAGAAVAVIIASAVGVAAMTGKLPGSTAAPAPAQPLAAASAPAPAAPAPAVAPEPAAAPPAPACANCGVVQSVSAYQSKPKNSPVGMIGGALVGGVVGNQIGDGGVNTIATLGGAAGGAYLGNKIGQKVQTKTRYRVVVRMDDGRKRTFTYAGRPDFAAGNQVRVEKGGLRHA